MVLRTIEKDKWTFRELNVFDDDRLDAMRKQIKEKDTDEDARNEYAEIRAEYDGVGDDELPPEILEKLKEMSRKVWAWADTKEGHLYMIEYLKCVVVASPVDGWDDTYLKTQTTVTELTAWFVKAMTALLELNKPMEADIKN